MIQKFCTCVWFRAKNALPAAWNLAIALTTSNISGSDIPSGSEQSLNEASEQEFLKTITPAPSVLWELYTHWGVNESINVCLQWMLKIVKGE